MPLKLPHIIGHRGAAGYAPENTIQSIHTAADMDIEWVSLDVKITKDEVPIIFHDNTLERTTNGTGLVAEATYKEIKELDCGSWYGDSFIGVQIPTLEEVVDVLIERELGLNLEIKPCPGREKDTAEVALDLLSTIWDDHDRLLISSLKQESLEAAFDVAQDWHRGLILPDELPDDWEALAKYLQVAAVSVNGYTIKREQVQSIIAMEKSILAYTIDDPNQARILQSWGVDGFFSDTPDLIDEDLFSVH